MHVTKAASHRATASHACNTAAPAGTGIMYAQSQPRLLKTFLDNQYKAQGGETYGDQVWSLCHINCEPFIACKRQLDSQQLAPQPAPRHQQYTQPALDQQIVQLTSDHQPMQLHMQLVQSYTCNQLVSDQQHIQLSPPQQLIQLESRSQQLMQHIPQRLVKLAFQSHQLMQHASQQHRMQLTSDQQLLHPASQQSVQPASQELLHLTSQQLSQFASASKQLA